ncbi:hypothetical protein PROFUN_02479 [Planoprotostelium fungivorum]|uniref:Glycosyl-hydrolase family 116 catalytic region domain-containing protein n=1 Tax=Planoprotostelium fungivorum TaxID=1890364 RepID=A0A2P6MP27_9EUKA|nr:hypothetical protein PROFUN_02479 [Planoprotostelium fungivorum]
MKSSKGNSQVWTGTTYALASTMILEGKKEMAFDTARGIIDTTYNTFGYAFQTPEGWDSQGRYRAYAYQRPLAIWLDLNIRICSASFSLFDGCLPELVNKLKAASGSEVELIVAEPNSARFEDTSTQFEVSRKRIQTLCNLLLSSSMHVHKVSKPIFNSTIQIGEEMINPLFKDLEKQFNVARETLDLQLTIHCYSAHHTDTQ